MLGKKAGGTRIAQACVLPKVAVILERDIASLLEVEDGVLRENMQVNEMHSESANSMNLLATGEAVSVISNHSHLLSSGLSESLCPSHLRAEYDEQEGRK